MDYKSKEIKLKGNVTALLRAPKAEDAAMQLEYLKAVAGETEYLMRYPEEYTITVEEEAKSLSAVVRSETSLMICCEIDGRLVGNCTLNFNSRIKTAHRATVAISILRDYWGLGIATALFGEMIRISKEKGVSQMELGHMEGNDRARRLYEKMGFVAVAETPNAFRLKDGTMLKEYFMVKYL